MKSKIMSEHNGTYSLKYISKQHPVNKIPSLCNRNVTRKSQIMRTIPQTVDMKASEKIWRGAS